MNLVLTVFAPFFPNGRITMYHLLLLPGESLLQLAVFSRYPIKEKQLVTYPNSNNCSLWCDIDINGQTIRLFNNHLQTTEVSRNKRKLEKNFVRMIPTVRNVPLSPLADGLHENFKKRAAQAEHINQLISASPYPTLVCGDFNSPFFICISNGKRRKTE